MVRQRREIGSQQNGLQEEDYLEEEEQEEVIEQFKRQAARQERYARQLIGLLGFILAIIYLLFSLHQGMVPWGIRHHAAFHGILKHTAVVAGELGGCVSVLLATLALLMFQPDQPPKLWKQLLQLASTLGIFEAMFWSTAIYKAAQQGGHHSALWRLLWLPVTPFGFALIIMHTINSLAALTPELVALRASKYRYKKA